MVTQYEDRQMMLTLFRSTERSGKVNYWVTCYFGNTEESYNKEFFRVNASIRYEYVSPVIIGSRKLSAEEAKRIVAGNAPDLDL